MRIELPDIVARSLTDRERYILEHSLLGDKGRLNREVAADLGISHSRASQLRYKAMRKLVRLLCEQLAAPQ